MLLVLVCDDHELLRGIIVVAARKAHIVSSFLVADLTSGTSRVLRWVLDSSSNTRVGDATPTPAMLFPRWHSEHVCVQSFGALHGSSSNADRGVHWGCIVLHIRNAVA